MRIGFDGKRAVQNFTGLGNYSRYIVISYANSIRRMNMCCMPPRNGKTRGWTN